MTLTYRCENEEEPFLLGPIDLTLQQGELMFLVGGNGSGKTTLGRLSALPPAIPDSWRAVPDQAQAVDQNPAPAEGGAVSST